MRYYQHIQYNQRCARCSLNQIAIDMELTDCTAAIGLLAICAQYR
jgi:hypothetical protein